MNSLKGLHEQLVALREKMPNLRACRRVGTWPCKRENEDEPIRGEFKSQILMSSTGRIQDDDYEDVDIMFIQQHGSNYKWGMLDGKVHMEMSIEDEIDKDIHKDAAHLVTLLVENIDQVIGVLALAQKP